MADDQDTTTETDEETWDVYTGITRGFEWILEVRHDD